MKAGDLILYDKFGTSWDSLSPSTIPDDFATGIILEILNDGDDDSDHLYAMIMKEDGSTGFFSLSYLVDLGHTFQKLET